MSNLIKADKVSHFENVLAYYLDDKHDEETKLNRLSSLDLELKEKWETAFTMLIKTSSTEQTVKKLVNLFKCSKATAYRYVQKSEMLFGDVHKFNKEARRYVQIERKAKLYKKALAAGELELAFKIDCQIDKLYGLDKDDVTFDPDKIAAQSYEIMMSSKMEKVFEKYITSGPIKMNDFRTIDVEHEEVEE